MAAGARRNVPWVLILAALPVLAYAPAWQAGVLLGPGDGAALHLPLRTETWRALDRGEIPSWNPASFSGTPLLAAYRPGAFHPAMVALTPLAPFTAFQALVLFSLALAAALGFLYARRLGAEPVGGLLTGLGFALGPYLVAHLGDTATVVAAPALPLVLLAVEDHLARPRAARAVGVALAATLLLLAGSPEAVGAAALLVGARLLVSLVHGRGSVEPPRHGQWSLVAALVAGGLLAGPQLVPTLLAWPQAGPGGSGAAAAPEAAVTGITGLVVRHVSHDPAPLFALAALPLLRTPGPLQAAGAAVFILGLLVGARPRPDEGGALPLAFGFALALFAGLSLSQQWVLRRESPGPRLRLLTAVLALFAVAGLAVATSVTGPLPRELAAPVGLLALAVILYVWLGGASGTVAASVFVLPLVASFLLQPWGRRAWEGAPTAQALVEGTPTRRAIDRVMGTRRRQRVLSIVESWPRSRSDDLAWANQAVFAGRRSVEGYDPLVPASRLRVFDGMGAEGTLPRAFLQTDPGRLEFLGVRWVQVPTSSLVVPVDEDGLGDAVNIILEPPRPKLFALPFTPATEVRIASFLAGSTEVRQGEIVAECVVRLATGREVWLPIRAGTDTAEWAWERDDVRAIVRHERAPILESFPVREGFLGHQYLGVLRLPGRFAVVGLRFRAWPGAPPLWLLRVGLKDTATGRASGVGLTSGYLSDEVRLREAAGTPLVTLFEVRRGVGPAWVVESLRRLADAERVGDLLRSPTRLGVDSRREALAVEGDVVGVKLPPSSRASGAMVARAVGGRLVVRAAGPGLLVVSEGWDAGWRAWVDGVPARALRVNGDRLGVVLEKGTHRVVFRHRARGLGIGIALALLAIVGLTLALARERLLRRRAVGVRD